MQDVLPALNEVEAAVRTRGLWAVGYLSYEAAPAFDPALAAHSPGALPLLWYGLYPPPQVSASLAFAQSARIPQYAWRPSVTKADYDAAIARIRALIAAGDTYQVNYSLRLHSELQESPEVLFARMVQANKPRYSVYLDTGRFVICSASPELFFELHDGTLSSKPMKGTTGRGLYGADDEAKAQRLWNSPKDRAENVMIVDMVRNDLGRIARTGSVTVPRLFETERYPTLWQMTSTVQARSNASFTQILQALFPAASITGAPKARATRIIAELETTARGVYTGCVGYLAPGGRARFNVAIRTAVIDRDSNRIEYGLGGGIVWDSTSSAEYAECLLKARIVTDAPPSFELLETLLWEPASGYFLLHEHLRRLRDSAHYLDVPADIAQVEAALLAAVPPSTARPQRVRLQVSRAGAIQLSVQPAPESAPARVAIAPAPVNRSNPFLYHKTTHREMYDQAKAACPGYDDVLLWNEAGEVTESTIANIAIERDGRFVTPPVRCGLLAGVYRGVLLAQGKLAEAPITLDELRQAPRLFLINSVRKWREAHLA
jgi:para-aminobenzoate synthetase / 4-amino-4-deoxychorismate lyase